MFDFVGLDFEDFAMIGPLFEINFETISRKNRRGNGGEENVSPILFRSNFGLGISNLVCQAGKIRIGLALFPQSCVQQLNRVGNSQGLGPSL